MKNPLGVGGISDLSWFKNDIPAVDGVDIEIDAGLVEGVAEREVFVHVTAIKRRFFTL